ncbi:MAG TPA: glycosyltransferase family 39 protein [Anaerolineales bacterium]|nr:MAG: hypothetical protein A2Z37_17905 [Chloroflexi bacterium RBG_19FT_COMBO_62_14]HLE04617.1 glycosyltransferase family 39 protein [Anaerolineales bacterium]
MVKEKRLGQLILAAMLVGYLLYAAVFIFQSSFVINGTRYFVLFDDAMISMQYARNFAHGQGLVWNAGGEHVEGYSNPLWVLVMAVFHLFPVPPPLMSLPVQVLSGLLLAFNLILVKKLAEELTAHKTVVGLVAVLLTAFYYPLNNWGLLGNEVALLTLFVTAAVWLAVSGLRRSEVSLGLYIMMAVGLLIRIDALVPFCAIWLYLALVDRRNRRKHLLWGGGLLVGVLLASTVFRMLYYGDVLPNTYYLKMTGYPVLLRIARGLYVMIQFMWHLNWVLLLFPFILFVVDRDKYKALLIIVFIAQIGYSVYVGGDGWENRGGSNRFVSIAMPLFFILFAVALDRLRQGLIAALGALASRRAIQTASTVAMVSFACVGLLNFNVLIYPSDLKYLLLRTRSVFIGGNARNVRIANYIQTVTGDQARVAVVAAGGIPYFDERYSIDLLGKSDRTVARGPAGTPEDYTWIDFRPGHMKWDYGYSIGKLQPDMVVEMLNGTSAQAQPYLRGYVRIEVPELVSSLPEGTLYLKRGSPNILWDRVEALIVEP